MHSRSYVLRVELPDRPGALGAVATAIGLVDGDILAMDIVERRGGRAVDDIVVELPSGRQPDVLITAAESVRGVRVESVRPDPGVASAHREWELVEALAARPAQAVATLAELLPQVLRAGWAVVVRADGIAHMKVLASGGGAPDLSHTAPDMLPMSRAAVLDQAASWVPAAWQALDTHLAAAPLGSPDVVVMIGRPGGPAMREAEVARLAHLAGMAATVVRRATGHLAGKSG